MNIMNQHVLLFSAWLALPGFAGALEANLLNNPGFEEGGPQPEGAASWVTAADSADKARLTEQEPHSGRRAIAIPANTALEQRVESLPPGAYLARCWIKSEAEQYVTFLVRNPERPWAAYTCAEIRVPQGKWTQIETFCPLDQAGPLTVTLGGMSKDFHLYHGTAQNMDAPIVADDFELVRSQATPPGGVAVWDAPTNQAADFEWPAREGWSRMTAASRPFMGTALIQAGKLAAAVRPGDGALVVYSLADSTPTQRCVVIPSPALPSSRCSLIQETTRTGIRITSDSGSGSYTAWFTTNGLIHIDAEHIAQFQVRDCHLRYGLLPSFAGTDLCYTPRELAKESNIPSTGWFVGLVEGNKSMLVAAWETNSQAVRLGAAGPTADPLIDTLAINTETGGLWLSFVEHPGIWHSEPLNEDWLGEYVPVSWERPFPARWMARLFVTSGGKSTFRDPGIGYSFPIACAKTRMWGVWFEDWNHYPFFFDGPKTVLHFDKTFVPQGRALFYFLEPAGADLLSPVEIAQQALGPDRAAALFDFEANQLRKLKYSTPDEFMFDRPVCATTTRLSKIKQEEKPTIGVELATHLYEFIAGIRKRVDEYAGFFSGLNRYLAVQQAQHPEELPYIQELQNLIAQAQTRSEQIYATPLADVQARTEQMKELLRQGKGDGFNCGDLDVRGPAGAQDDLCRRYNRYVMKLTQTAAAQCGDSPAKAAIATYIWQQSRGILRRPTRWEPRRTLYFFEP